ncbi:myb-like protein D [Lucilia sericata]|uniref:myb-like protein D n=1 Tax=Lucilia sericata TaxID=13632 RepID=UPI0018A81418|nr:myb-like protein D [Lucilia sericata]
MNRKLCLLFLVCLAVVLVKSESSVEIDENGDEYDVKRFNIQSRQLNGGRSQCVVTRRKRATQPKPVYSDDGSNDEVDDKNDDGDTMLGMEQQAVLYYSPPVINQTADEDEEEEDDKEGDENTMKEMDNENEGGANDMEDMKEKSEEDEKMNENDNEEEDGDNDTIEVVQLPQLPILGQLQSDGETVAAVAASSASGSTHVGHHNGNHAGSNGIVVVQSHTPPKVNPQTHAVFELVPVNHAGPINGEEDEEEEESHVPEQFDFNEELSPITTTAIWSTGDDNSNMNYDELDSKPVRPQKLVKKVRKPVRANKNKRKSALKPKRKINKRRNNIKRKNLKNKKNKKKSTYKRRLTKNKRRRNNRRRPYRTNSVRRRHPVRRNKVRRGNVTRRRLSQANSQSQNQVIRTQLNNLNSNQNSNKNSLNSQLTNNNKGTTAKDKIIQKKNKNKKHSEVIDQGEDTYTRTMTMTQTGDEDGDRNVNCIIIRKDPPPTTARPFWNILGRSANGTPKASGHFGKRKRVNVRFVA